MKDKKILYIVLACVIIGIIVFLILKNKSESNVLKIDFYDNTSTGFFWKYSVSNEGYVEITNDSDYSNCDHDVDGCGGKKIYTIKPLKAGKVTIIFEWVSPNNVLEKNAIYNIEIADDLTIKETHTGSYFQND